MKVVTYGCKKFYNIGTWSHNLFVLFFSLTRNLRRKWLSSWSSTSRSRFKTSWSSRKGSTKDRSSSRSCRR